MILYNEGVLDDLDGQWYKLLAFVLLKYHNGGPVNLTMGDITKFSDGMPVIVCEEKAGTFNMWVVSEEDALKLIAERRARKTK